MEAATRKQNVAASTDARLSPAVLEANFDPLDAKRAAEQGAQAATGPSLENSGACLEPAGADEEEPYREYVRPALRFDPAGSIAAMVVTPSFRPPWMLSLHHGRNGKYMMRVTRLDQDVSRAMMTRMQERQGGVVSLASDLQAEALTELSVTATRSERTVDRHTARLFAELWRRLIRRVQVVRADGATFDGVSYYLWQGGSAGTTVSPRDRSVLEQATFTAERLRDLVEQPKPGDEEDFAFFREEMREAIARTKRKEACLRPYRE